MRLHTGGLFIVGQWDDLYLRTGSGYTYHGDVDPPVCTDVITLEEFESISEWTVVGTSNTFVTGRSGQGLQLAGGVSGDGIAYDIPSAAQSATITVGFAYRTNNLTARPLLQLRSDSGATIHNTLNLSASAPGDLSFIVGGVLNASTAGALITVNTWHYIELQATLGDSPDGNFKVRIDGVERLALTGRDTKNLGTKVLYDQFRLVRPTVSGTDTNQYDDLYISTGAICAFRGDINPPVSFPVIATTNTKVEPSLTANQPLPLPAGITAGDLLVCFFANDGNTVLSTGVSGGGWTMIAQTVVGTTHRLGVLARIANGVNTGGNDACSINGSGGDYSASLMRITGHGVTNVATDIKLAMAVDTGSADPPQVDTGVNGKWLWLAAAAVDGTTGTAITAMPASYTEVANLLSVAGGSISSSLLAVAERDVETRNENPGAFTNTARDWAAATVAIPPVGITFPAVGYKTALGTTTNNTSASTLVITTTAAIAIGDLVVVRVASSNQTATTPTFTCADSGGNTYTTHAERSSGHATANAGVIGGVMATKATSAVAAGGTITITLSVATAAKAAYAESFVGFDNTTRSTPATTFGDTLAAVTVTSGAVNSGDLVVAACLAESRTSASVADTDTLNGSWSTIVNLPSSTSGTDTDRVMAIGQYKITTGAGAQTWDITHGLTPDWAAVLVVFQAT